jgi:putative flippase GtrA
VENDYSNNMKSTSTILNLKFIKYCITGVFNTVHHYVWFLLLSPVIGYSFANLLAFLVANIASFFINSYFTFRVLPTKKSFIRYPSVMIVQAIISYLVPLLCLTYVPQSKLFVPILTTIINLPIGYLLTKKVLSPH